MGEAILVGRQQSSSGSSGYVLKSVLITENTTWVAPESRGQKFSVRIFGGGGGYANNGNKSGGGGYMNNGILSISKGTSVKITIWAGKITSDATGGAGGTTTFGSYLSAAGGQGGSNNNGCNGGSGGGGTENGGHGFQFGGGGCGSNIHDKNTHGGNGGTWGGGGAGFINESSYGWNGVCIIQYYAKID